MKINTKSYIGIPSCKVKPRINANFALLRFLCPRWCNPSHGRSSAGLFMQASDLRLVHNSTLWASGKGAFDKHEVSAAQKCWCPRKGGSTDDQVFIRCHVYSVHTVFYCMLTLLHPLTRTSSPDSSFSWPRSLRSCCNIFFLLLRCLSSPDLYFPIRSQLKRRVEKVSTMTFYSASYNALAKSYAL